MELWDEVIFDRKCRELEGREVQPCNVKYTKITKCKTEQLSDFDSNIESYGEGLDMAVCLRDGDGRKHYKDLTIKKVLGSKVAYIIDETTPIIVRENEGRYRTIKEFIEAVCSAILQGLYNIEDKRLDIWGMWINSTGKGISLIELEVQE